MMSLMGKRLAAFGRRHAGFKLGLGLLIFMAAFAWAVPAQAWWNEAWLYRKPININAGVLEGASLKDFPVLLRLHAGNFEFAKAQPAGEDIRFVAGDDQTLLDHHIEYLDELEEIALVWVRLPELSGATGPIWMYYGNAEARAAINSAKTYGAETVGVFHFAEGEGAPQDSSSYQNHAEDFSVGQGFASIIGRGASFNGVNDRVVLPDSPSLDFTNGLTFSTWIRLFQPQQDSVLFSTGEEDALTLAVDGTTLVASLTVDDFTPAIEVRGQTELTLGQYHHVTLALAPGNTMSIYLDGQLAGETALTDPVPPLRGARLGTDEDGNRFAAAEMDEVNLATQPRPVAWAKAQHSSQGPEASLAVFGQEEAGETGSLSLYYFSIIMDNLTSEAWAILGVLMIMSVISWLIMLTKAFFLAVTERENAGFMEEFEELEGGVMELYEDEEETTDYKNSVIYPMYVAGCKEVEILQKKANMDELALKKPRKGTTLVEKALERQFMRESRKLNSYLVFMTVAISGGPFLGLLGTVWGVMNTFAALTLAGEASLTAIAPGIASSLTTTVFGLLVAIPALFGYNYLVTKIKNISGEMVAFIDLFTEKAEEVL